MKELEDAYKEAAKDSTLQAEIKAWDCTLGDGLEDEDWEEWIGH